MSISYTQPLSMGWNRMKKALFQPFDLTKWFRIGFTAWLAGLTDCKGGSNGGGNANTSHNNWDDFFNYPDVAKDWLFDNPLWFNLIIVGVVLLFIVLTVITWVSSRGKFMFLHNVAHEKSEISEPWKEYSKEGNSLFLWNFFVGWILVGAFVLFFVHCFIAAKELYYGDHLDAFVFWEIAKLVLIFIGLIVCFGYLTLFLKDFVVPIMYKKRIGVLNGWSHFLKLFGKYFFTFTIYGLFVFVLGIGVVFVVITFALITCCIGLLLMAIPYIGAVLILPISYLFRAFSVEFLAQFGDEFNVFPKTVEEGIEM